MQSFQVIERLQAFLEVLQNSENSPLLDLLKILAKGQEDLEEPLANLLNHSGDINQIAPLFSQYRSRLANLKPEIKNVKPRVVFSSINRFREALILFLKAMSGEANDVLLHVLIRNSFLQLDKFEDVYEEFINDYLDQSTAKLINIGTILLASLEGIKKLLMLTMKSLQNQYYEGNSEGFLSLLLDSDHTYEEFTEKLEALHSLYSTICHLLAVAENDFPLKIVKVESGSLFVKVFGEPKVIGFILSLIQDTTSFLYRSKTVEGRIASIPKKIEVVEEVLKLREKLKEAGIEAPALDESIEKSSILIAGELNTLLAGEPLVELNGELLPTEGYQTQRVLGGNRRRYLLESSKDNAEADK